MICIFSLQCVKQPGKPNPISSSLKPLFSCQGWAKIWNLRRSLLGSICIGAKVWQLKENFPNLFMKNAKKVFWKCHLLTKKWTGFVQPCVLQIQIGKKSLGGYLYPWVKYLDHTFFDKYLYPTKTEWNYSRYWPQSHNSKCKWMIVMIAW